MQIAIINEQIVPIEQLDPIYLDRGTFFGDGVYEVLRSYNGKIFALSEHLERFAHSLAAIEITGIEINWVRSMILKAFEAADIANAKIYFHVTRGSEMRDHLWKDEIKPNFFLTITELGDDSETKSKGINVSTFPDLRWKRCDIKSLNLLPNVLARRDAARKNCTEAILVNDTGYITEGSASAFFAIQDGKLHTSPLAENILPSITRIFVLKAAGNINLPIVEKSIKPEDAILCDELFIAVTTKDIVPVVKFDGNNIADGKPGKYTKALAEEFRKFIS